MELKQEGLQAIVGSLALSLAKIYRESAQQTAIVDNKQLLNVDYLLHKIDDALRCQEIHNTFVRCVHSAGLDEPPCVANHTDSASAFASLAAKLIRFGGPATKNAAIDSLHNIQKVYEQQAEAYQNIMSGYAITGCDMAVLQEKLATTFCCNYAQAASALYAIILNELRGQQHGGVGVQSFVVEPAVRLEDVLSHLPDAANAEGQQYSELALAMPDISWQMAIIKKAVNLE